MKAKELGDELVVIVNNDHQASLKKGQAFMPCQERCEILRNIKGVDQVIASIDEDRTVCRTLEAINPDIFCNGGDQNNDSIPEASICHKLGIKMVDGLGDKIQSSSWLISKVVKNKDKCQEIKHDLKNILHGINGYTELLVFCKGDDPDVRKYCHEIDLMIQTGLKSIDQKLE